MRYFGIRDLLREEAVAEGTSAGLPPPAVEDPAVARLTAELDRQKQDNARLRAQIQVPPPPPAPSQPGAVDKKALEKQFWDNPLDMVAAISTHAAQTVAQQQGQVGFDTLVETAKQQVRNGPDSDVWDKYALEIEAKVNDSVQPQFRGSVNVWRNAFNIVKGEHVTDIIKMRAQGAAPTVRGADGPAPPSPRSPAPPRETPLTDDERLVAGRFDLTDEAYRSAKLNYDNQPGKTLPSSWDKVITFSSADKRKRERAANAARTK